MKQYIVGINLPIKSHCHESGVALIDFEGNILFAVNEERLSRVKLDGDFPEAAIKAMIEYTGIKKEEVAYVVVPTLTLRKKIARALDYLIHERLFLAIRPATYKTLFRFFRRERTVRKESGLTKKGFTMRYYWRDFINKHLPKAQIVAVDHHIAHAAGAHFSSPWENNLIITIDGAGNWLSSVVAEGKGSRIRIKAKTFIPHSVGTFWGSITKVCGFASGTRHGGKVTGLAASGDSSKFIEKLRTAIWCAGLQIRTREELFFKPGQLAPNWNDYEPSRMKHYLGEGNREDFAAAAQKRLEEVLIELVKNARKVIPYRTVVLAGGVFANVLLNQKILEMPEVDDIYVFPAMSDGGLALGAAMFTLASLKRKLGNHLIPRPLQTIYLGPSYNKNVILQTLDTYGLRYRTMGRPAEEVGRLLHEGKVVALYHGRMEYGPRALGNRSILYAPIDPSVNDWLNKRLNRSEFMPFAPVTLIEQVQENYKNIGPDPIAARYMTITYNCTEKMKRLAPACVHLDNTARPQVISRDQNPFYYDIIREYYRLSGIPTLINTSFNMHEEPIVCTPEDAVRAFLASEIDYLILEDMLVSISENQSAVKRFRAAHREDKPRAYDPE